MAERYVNYNDFSNPNQNNFQMHQHLNQPYHDNAIQKSVHPRIVQQAANVLFVADLPEDTCEEDLMNIFKDHQYLVSRVTNTAVKTFALVHFKNAEAAEKARNELNGVKITAKYATIKVPKPMRLCRWETKVSINERKVDDYKKNLLIKNINKDVSAHYFWNLVKKYGDIRSCKLAIDFAGSSKGFGYVTYYNVIDAEEAREKLNGYEVMGKQLGVEFLQPGLKKALRKNNIYVKHFPKENFSNEALKNLFEKYGEVSSVLVAPDKEDPLKSKGFGFVCFKRAEDAEKAQIDLNGKKLWDDLPNIYVNFAMKKEERLEHLQKKKEELKRNASKMTLFCKIKEGFSFNSETEFNAEIMRNLAMCFGKEYFPRSLKSRIDTRTAFITLNSVQEVQQFVNFYTDHSKTNDSKLFFNQYKSKLERVNASNIMKKYNDFGNNSVNIHQVESGSKHPFRNYNNFDQLGGNLGNQTNMNMAFMNNNNIPNFNNQMINDPQFMQMMMQQQNSMMRQQPQGIPTNIVPQTNQGFKVYNNFNEDVNNTNTNINTTNTNNSNNNVINEKQNTKNTEEMEEEEKEELLDNIYEYVFKKYSEDAPKITGMIRELSLVELRELLNNETKLDNVVKSAYHQLHN